MNNNEVIIEHKLQHNLGQFFTTDKSLQEKVYEFVLNKPSLILEPSMGAGHLVKFIQAKLPTIIFDMHEIDTTIILLDGIDKSKIIYGDFLINEITKKYDTIIGNPPYVKTTKGNLYIDFIEKCYNLLNNNGELIFIIPSDFFKLTSASSLLNTMFENGSFTHIYHPHNEKLFEGASIDVIVFRYCKNKELEKTVNYNNDKMYISNSNGLITFGETKNTNTKCINDYFDVYVGIVSGKDEVYKNHDLGNIDVLVGDNKTEKFIYIEQYPSSDVKINKYLLDNKNKLMERKIRKFTDKNWFEWGAPRNIKTVEQNLNKECIYIHNLTRLKTVAFKSKVNYFGGNLLMLIPKETINLDKVVNYLNDGVFKNNFMYSGRFKIGHRQISNSLFDISNFI